MKTALLLTNSDLTRRQFEAVLGSRLNLIVVEPPAEPSLDRFAGLLSTWHRLADVIILDGVALGQGVRWAVEALTDLVNDGLPVIYRVTDQQRQLFPGARSWLVLREADPLDQMVQSVFTYLDLAEARARLERTVAANGPSAPTVPPANGAFDSYRYREALKAVSRLLGRNLSERELVADFLGLTRDLLGAGKLAIFLRQTGDDLFAGGHAGTTPLRVAGSVGLGVTIVEHLRLTPDGGIAAWLQREVRILRRGQATSDVRIEREFDLLGTEVAVPMFDNDRLLGVLTFSGKITGELHTNEELELVYQLLAQLAQALCNLQLAGRVANQQKLIAEVLANIHSGVLVVGQDEKILAINECARQLLDLNGDALVGQPLARIPSRVADVVFELFQQSKGVCDREVLLPRVNRPLRICASRFAQSATGQVVAVALIEDLTQHKLEQARSRELADREFLMRLAFRLSHELKNSLVSIKIFAQLLPEKYSEKDFREQFSSVVANEVNRVDVLVNNLTFFSHPLALVHEEVVVTDWLDACLKNVTQEFARKQIALVLNIGEKAPEGTVVPVVTVKKNYSHKIAKLEGDKLRLMQAVEQLLRNALQSMPAGGRLAVSTSDAQEADLSGGAIRVEIQDSGEGISLENLPRVTEPFFTTRNVGVGLGLTIVKKIVERHGGRFEVDSVLGRGTKATLVVPVKVQPHPEDVLMDRFVRPAVAAHEDGDPVAAENRLPKSA